MKCTKLVVPGTSDRKGTCDQSRFLQTVSMYTKPKVVRFNF